MAVICPKCKTQDPVYVGHDMSIYVGDNGKDVLYHRLDCHCTGCDNRFSITFEVSIPDEVEYI